MPFPLGGSSVSESVEVFPSHGADGLSPNGVSLILDVSADRTIKVFPAHFGLHFAKHRTVDVEVFRAIPAYEHLVIDVSTTIIHRFSGIGGVRFAPSFPQWDRQETSYPFAF